MMRFRRQVTVSCAAAAAAAALWAVAGCDRGQPMPGAGAPRRVRQIGSTTVLPLAEEWRKGFNKAEPDIDISVSGGGSGTGIKALIAGTAEIANASREIEPKEVEQARAGGVEPVEHTVAYDGIAVIVHPSNPLEELSVQQISNIFSGRATDWRQVGGRGGEIQVISRDSASGTYEAFKELVVTMQGRERERDYAPAALKQTSNQAVLALCARTKTAIGYVGLGYLDDSVRALEVIPIDGEQAVAATVGEVTAGRYPVARALYCYTNGEPSGVLKQYLDWVKGPEGQAIVEELGFVPVRQK